MDNQEVAANTPVLSLDSKILAHLPLLLHEDPKTALTVGFGSGGTSYSMLRHDLESVDAVEIEEKVIEASGYFDSLNHGILENNKLNIILDDARSYLLLTDKKYDVISTDVTNIKYNNNANLYTKEYFEIIKSRLNSKGVVAVWVPIRDINGEGQKILMNTFREVFPHMSVWYMYNKLSHYFVYIGMEEELEIDYGIFIERFNREEVRKDLEEVGVTQYNFLNALFLDEDTVLDYVSGSGIHSDNNPILEFPDLVVSEDSFTFGENVISIYKRKIDPRRYISGFDNSLQKRDFLEGFEYEQEEVAWPLIAGHTAILRGDNNNAAIFYKKAIENSNYLEAVDII